MIINVAGIIKELGGKLEVSGAVSFEATDFLGEEFVFSKPLDIKGTISNNGESLVLKAQAEGMVDVHCARCLKPLTVKINFPVEETFLQGDGEVSEDEDVILFSGNEIAIDDVVMNHFLMNAAGKYLCKEDCKGLCAECGADLNEGDCDCNKDVIDPRWAALKEIMDRNDDEVIE